MLSFRHAPLYRIFWHVVSIPVCEAFAAAVVDLAMPMQTHDRVSPLLERQMDVHERAVAAVSQNDIAFPEEPDHFFEYAAFVVLERGLDP